MYGNYISRLEKDYQVAPVCISVTSYSAGIHLLFRRVANDNRPTGSVSGEKG